MLDRDLGTGLVVIGGLLCQFVAVHTGETGFGSWVSQMKCGSKGPLTEGATGLWAPPSALMHGEISAMFHLASLLITYNGPWQMDQNHVSIHQETRIYCCTQTLWPSGTMGYLFVTNASQSLVWDSLLSVTGESWDHSLTMFFGPRREQQRNPTFLCFLKHKKCFKFQK